MVKDLELTIKAMASGGWGMSFVNKRAVFVPYTIEGEKVIVRVVRHDKNADFAQGVKLVQASADRVYPACTHFGDSKCWGCQWQHIRYEAQLLMKFDVLAEQVQRYSKLSDAALGKAIQPVIPSPKEWGYAHQASFKRDKGGALGFLRQDGRGIEPINECRIMHPDLQAFYETVDVDFDDLRSVSLYLGSDGQTMALLEMTSENLPELETDFATSVNVLLPDNEPINLFGDSLVRYTVGGRSFRVTAGSFFRANLSQMDNLIGQVLQGLKLTGKEAVLDLYAGVGVYSAFIAPRASLVTVCESYPPAVTDADENLAGLDNVDVVEGSVEELLADIIEEGGRYDVVLLDPPPNGLNETVLDSLLQLKPARIVYVSSSAASFGRDTQRLTQGGYTLERLQPLDFAPHTYYVESVGTFVRR